MSSPEESLRERIRDLHGPLVAAAWSGDLEELRHLLETGEPVGDERAHRAMEAALAKAHAEVVRHLLAVGFDPNREDRLPPLIRLLDGPYHRELLELLLGAGADVEIRHGPRGETPLHVAVRRRRLDAVRILLAHGADVDARTRTGRTPYAHAVCRPFDEIAAELARHGASTRLTTAEQLCASLVRDELPQALGLVAAQPDLVPGLNQDDARILPDLAGQGRLEAVELLLDAGADIAWRGLDGGTALHQACWFAQPEVARFLIERGAPLELACEDHVATPLHWVAHGSRYSGGAEANASRYVALAELLIQAGASFADAADPEGDPHGRRLLDDAVPAVRVVLERHGARAD